MSLARHYAPKLERRSELHRQIEASCGLSEAASMLLVELDVFDEVVLSDDAYLAAFAELEAKGLAELSAEPHACVHAVPTFVVREVMERVRNIVALEGELARRARPPEPAPPRPSRGPNAPLTEAEERTLIDDALGVIARAPVLPDPSQVRVYLRSGPKYVRVFWTYRGRSDDVGGSILHFVEKRTGRVYAAKSARQVGRFTGRVVPGFGEADA